MPEPQQWYYAENNQQRGPVPLDALRALVRAGTVGPRDLVWTQGMADWQPAGSVAELAPPPAVPEPTLESQPTPINEPSWPPSSTASPPHPFPPPPPHRGPLGYHNPGVAAGSYKGMAIASFVLALVGLIACVPGALFGVVALFMALRAMDGMKRTGNTDGHGLAVAGLVIGIVDIFWLCPMVIG